MNEDNLHSMGTLQADIDNEPTCEDTNHAQLSTGPEKVLTGETDVSHADDEDEDDDFTRELNRQDPTYDRGNDQKRAYEEPDKPCDYRCDHDGSLRKKRRPQDIDDDFSSDSEEDEDDVKGMG